MTTVFMSPDLFRPPASHLIPRQRPGDPDAPTFATCPVWCAGHPGGEASQGHHSQEIRIRVGETRYWNDELKVGLAQSGEDDGKAAQPTIMMGERELTAGQAKSLAAALALLSSVAGRPAGEDRYDQDQNPSAAVRTMSHYGAGAASAAHLTAAGFATDIAAMVCYLAGVTEAIRMIGRATESVPYMLIEHRLYLARHALAEIFDDLIASGEPDTLIADLINRKVDVADAVAASHRPQWLTQHRPPEGEPFNTSLECLPWCRDSGATHCRGTCMSEGTVIPATANGGQLEDNGMRFPMIEVYSGFTYPDRKAAVHIVPAGPCGKSEISGWTEFTPAEAKALAKAIDAEADLMAAWLAQASSK